MLHKSAVVNLLYRLSLINLVIQLTNLLALFTDGPTVYTIIIAVLGICLSILLLIYRKVNL